METYHMIRIRFGTWIKWIMMVPGSPFLMKLSKYSPYNSLFISPGNPNNQARNEEPEPNRTELISDEIIHLTL